VLPESKLLLKDYISRQSEARFDRFAYQLGHSRKSTPPDSVHDLRVSIRRYESCLAVFETFFPPRPVQKFQRRLRKVLKPAGAVRDSDIALGLAKAAGVINGAPLLKEITKQREHLAKAFRDDVKGWAKQNSSDKWRRRLAVTAPHKDSKSKWNAAATSAENAAAVLPKLTGPFFRAGRKVAVPEAPDEKLHRFRLKVKRFRYMLELFRPCYGPTLDEHIGTLKELQDHLGNMNDCAFTLGMLAKPALKDLDGAEQLKAYLTERIQGERAAFLEYWEHALSGPGTEQRWTDYLERFAGRVSKPNHSCSAAVASVCASA
jgi:CHAD domain-containing protein